MVTPEHHVALVDRLVESSHPVRTIWPVRSRMAVFLAPTAVLGLLVACTWPRPDLAMKLDQPGFILEILLLGLATGFSALLALRCAVPGRAPTWLETAAALLLISAACSTFAMDTEQARQAAGEGWRCATQTIALASVPWALLSIAIRRGAPVRVTSAAFYAATSALLFAATVLRTTCPIDNARHWLLWHLAMVPLVTVLSTPLGARWLRTWRHG
jgi:hypothetical protein